MIKVYIPSDKNFNYEECKKLFYENQEKVNDFQNFDDILKNSLFYSFFADEKHLGCLYFYLDDGKLFVNAFGRRHNHLENIECLKMALTWFNCDIYAYSKQKPAIYCVLKCGFKKVSENTYKYERE